MSTRRHGSPGETASEYRLGFTTGIAGLPPRPMVTPSLDATFTYLRGHREGCMVMAALTAWPQPAQVRAR